MNWIALANLASRWILFLAVAYKAYQIRDKGWAILATAFFIAAFDVETYILNPLGLKVLPGLGDITSIFHVIIETLLVLWAVLHLKFRETKFHHVVAFSALVVVSYLWIFLIAIGIFGDSFVLEYSFPMFFYGGTLLYLSCVLWKYVLGKRLLDGLFPAGIAIVGVLNITYPFTRHITWFANIAFFTAAIGRIIAAIGAILFVFYPIKPPEPHPAEESKTIPSGAYIVSSPEEFRKLTGKEGGIIGITRIPPDDVHKKFPRGSVIFWPTKATEGILKDNDHRVVAVSPTKLGILQDLIAKELESGARIVYVDALEYLKMEAGFLNALKFLLFVKDVVIQKGGAIFLYFNEKAFDEREVKIIRREFQDFKQGQASP